MAIESDEIYRAAVGFRGVERLTPHKSIVAISDVFLYESAPNQFPINEIIMLK